MNKNDGWAFSKSKYAEDFRINGNLVVEHGQPVKAGGVEFRETGPKTALASFKLKKGGEIGYAFFRAERPVVSRGVPSLTEVVGLFAHKITRR